MSAVGGKACVGVFHFNAVVSPAVNVLLLVIVIHRDIMVKIQLKYTEYAVAVRRIAHGSDRKAVAFTFKGGYVHLARKTLKIAVVRLSAVYDGEQTALSRIHHRAEHQHQHRRSGEHELTKLWSRLFSPLGDIKYFLPCGIVCL